MCIFYSITVFPSSLRQSIQIRMGEKKILNNLNKKKGPIRHPIPGRVKDTAMKVAILLQIGLDDGISMDTFTFQ